MIIELCAKHVPLCLQNNIFRHLYSSQLWSCFVTWPYLNYKNIVINCAALIDRQNIKMLYLFNDALLSYSVNIIKKNKQPFFYYFTLLKNCKCLYWMFAIMCLSCLYLCVCVCVKVKSGSTAAGSTDQVKPSTWQHASFWRRRSSKATTTTKCPSVKFWASVWSCL